MATIRPDRTYRTTVDSFNIEYDHEPMVKSARSRLGRIMILSLLAVIVIASASSHTLLAQPFKMDLGIPGYRVPLLHSLITCGSFPIAFIIWIIISKGNIEIPSISRWKSFLILAILDAGNVFLGSVALNDLPAATYAILRGSSLIFVVIFSKMATSKQFNIYQYIGVGLMMVAVVLMAFTDNPSDKESMINIGLGGICLSTFLVLINDDIGPDRLASLIAALGGSVFVSLLSVATQRLFAAEQSKANFQFICQINTCQSFLSTLLILPFALLSNEFSRLPSDIDVIRSNNQLTSMITLLIGMYLSAPLMLFANIGLTSFSSATFARSLGGPRRIVIIVLSYLIFHQSINWATVSAAVFMSASLAIYIYGGYRLQISKRDSIQ